MSTDTHTKIREEVERRLAIARAAEGADWTLDERAPYGPKVGEWSREVNVQMWECDDEQDGCPDAARGWVAEARLIAIHDPADAIRRYEYALKVLDRHPPCTDDACAGSDCHRCVEFMPCEPIRDLAESLGIDTGGQP